MQYLNNSNVLAIIEIIYHYLNYKMLFCNVTELRLSLINYNTIK